MRSTFQLVHKPSSITLNPLIWADCEESYFGKSFFLKNSKGYPSKNFSLFFPDNHRLMVAIEHQFDNVLFGHFGDLLEKYIFEVNQKFQRLPLLVIFNNFECEQIVIRWLLIDNALIRKWWRLVLSFKRNITGLWEITYWSGLSCIFLFKMISIWIINIKTSWTLFYQSHNSQMQNKPFKKIISIKSILWRWRWRLFWAWIQGFLHFYFDVFFHKHSFYFLIKCTGNSNQWLRKSDLQVVIFLFMPTSFNELFVHFLFPCLHYIDQTANYPANKNSNNFIDDHNQDDDNVLD